MCGIAGFVDSAAAAPMERKDSFALVQRMCRVIRHRGPDDGGVLVEPGIGIGMRRLSVIDLETGRQPLPNEDHTVWTVFNGEIYNFRDLRRELESCGHHFATLSDTEVIVHAYEEWGADAIARLRGMFGLAIWDAKQKTLLLARDRVGIKPLYYAAVKGRLYFGSEIKSLLCAPDVPRDLDLDAFDHYLSFLYTPADGSIFRSVRKLPPGHVLTWKDGQLSIDRYWQLPADEAFKGSESEAVEGLQEVLTRAVQSHLVSDVPVGAFLSGGVDSSLVVALMARASAGRVRTFSIGFDEPAFDELQHARAVAAHCGTDHHEFIVRPDAVSVLNELIEHFDEPFADASAIPTWYVSQMASRHVTVVLSGDGGDELFGGYDRYLPHATVSAFDRYAPGSLGRVASLAADHLPHGMRGRKFLRHVGLDSRGRYLDSIGFFSPDEKPALLSEDVQRALGRGNPEDRLARRFERYAHLPWGSQMMRFDGETYLPEDILTKVDRMSMAHSIESRVPLLDHEVVEFASGLPQDLKIKDGRRKHILKEVAARLLPRQIIDRPKQGFAMPLNVWFRGNLHELFADTLLSATSLRRGYFQPRFVTRLVHEHLSGKRDHALRLWQLVVFERWHRLYVDQGSAGALNQAAAVMG